MRVRPHCVGRVTISFPLFLFDHFRFRLRARGHVTDHFLENIVMTREHIVRVANVPAAEINTCFGIKEDFEDLE